MNRKAGITRAGKQFMEEVKAKSSKKLKKLALRTQQPATDHLGAKEKKH